MYNDGMTPDDLKQWRRTTGYSQGRLAKDLGVATQTVFRWEKAKRQIPPFLHLALRWLEQEGGEHMVKAKRKRKEVNDEWE